MNIFKTTQQKGFVILFAVLISAIILLIGAGVLSISVKETLLSSAARESQFAINAADSGVECALYRAFVTPNNACFNSGVIMTNDGFNLLTPSESIDSCANVLIYPTLNQQTGFTEVKIISRGFNICDNLAQPVTDDPRLLERVYRVKYIAPTPPAVPTP